jgi:cell division protein ZapB
MNDSEIKHLEDQVDALLLQLKQLKSENSSLRESQTSLVTERARLIDKTEKARSRVEAIITRLKAMEIEA